MKTRLDKISTIENVYSGVNNMFYMTSFNAPINDERYIISSGHEMYFKIDATKFHKYASIKSIKLKLKKISQSTSMAFRLFQATPKGQDSSYSEETIVTSNTRDVELELIEMIDLNSVEYFKLRFLSSSSIYNNSAIDEYKPQIEVTYIDDKESSLNQDYLEHNSKEIHTKINKRTGRPTFTKNIMNVESLVYPLNLNLVFDPLEKNNRFGLMPKGWKFNYDVKLIENEEGFELIDNQCLRHQFVRSLNDVNIYYDISKTGLMLSKNGNEYLMSNDYNDYMLFDSNGNLKRVYKNKNVYTYGLTFERDSNYNITKIKECKIEELGLFETEVINITYSSTKITITSTKKNPTCEITINSNNNLSLINNEDYRTVLYTYDSSNRLVEAKSDEPTITAFTYDKFDRVQTCTRYTKDLNTIVEKHTLEYGLLSTILTNYKNVIMRYLYDEEGLMKGSYEIVENEITNLQTIEKEDETIRLTISNENMYNRYNDLTVNRTESAISIQTLEHNQTASKGNLLFEEEKTYQLLYIYNFVGFISKDTDAESYIEVCEGNNVLVRKILNKTCNDTLDSFIFKKTNNNDITIKVTHQNDRLTLNLKSIILKEVEEISIHNCINDNEGNSKSFTINNKTFFVYQNDGFFYGDTEEYVDKKMYFSDLLENIKNLKKSNSTFNVWYNDKRGLIYNTKNIYVATDYKAVLLTKNLLIGTVTEKKIKY